MVVIGLLGLLAVVAGLWNADQVSAVIGPYPAQYGRFGPRVLFRASKSWEPIAMDRLVDGIIGGVGSLFWIFSIVIVLLEPHGPNLLVRDPTFGTPAAIALLLGIAVAAGAVTGLVVGVFSSSSVTPLECERGERRPSMRLHAAVASVPIIAGASFFVLEPQGGQRVALVLLLPLAAFVLGGFVAWTVCRRVGLGRCRHLATSAK